MTNNAHISNLKIHQENINELKSLENLRSLISNYLNVNQNISFRNNTTSILIDVLQSIDVKDDYTLIYSDLEHPCVQNVIPHFFPKDKIVFLKLYDLLLDGDFEKIEEKLSAVYAEKSIYLFSHVLWNTGVKLNIELMSKNIKKHNSDNLIIIDGAQAVGNLPQLFSNEFENNIIDFYVGCTHKWIGTKNLLGFVVVSDEIMLKKQSIVNKIFLKDIFSTFAGEISLLKIDWSMSTYNTLLLLQITKGLIEIFTSNINEKIISNKQHLTDNIYSIPSTKSRETKYFAFYGLKKHLIMKCDLLNIEYSHIIDDDQLPNNYSWLRLER